VYLLVTLTACRDEVPKPPPPAPEAVPEAPAPVGVVSDVAAAREAVAAGEALALVSSPLGVLAVGRGRPGMLGRPSNAPAALEDWLSDALKEGQPVTRLLLLDPSWETASADALCAAARSQAGAALPCERGPVALLEDPEAALEVEVLREQIHIRGELTPAARAAAVAVAVAGEPALLGCYQAAREARGTAAGRLVLELAVGPAGGVVDTAVVRGWDQADFEGCIQEVARTWSFPSAPEGAMMAFPVMFGTALPPAEPSPAMDPE